MTNPTDSGPLAVRTAAGVAARAMVAAVPVVGPLLAEFVSSYSSERQLQRLKAWAEALGIRIDALVADKVDISYVHHEDYVAYLLRVMEIAASAHRAAKILLLAEVAAGALRPDSTDLWRDKFLGATDVLTAAHVAVLRGMEGDEVWLRTNSEIVKPTLGQRFPYFAQGELELILRDLAGIGFVEDSGMGRISVESGMAWRPTETAARFLDFLVSSLREPG